ncbi:MAG: hypothetical protein ACI9RM_002073 [Ulvibacter sp.]|jgi:hypothetical protein
MKKNIKELSIKMNKVLTKAQMKVVKGGDGPPTEISILNSGG